MHRDIKKNLKIYDLQYENFHVQKIKYVYEPVLDLIIDTIKKINIKVYLIMVVVIDVLVIF
jgi:hypothetical protein